MTFKTTTNHEEIRNWIEEHNGIPAISEHAPGEIRLAIRFGDITPPYERISWEEFFDRFESSNIAFRYEVDGEEVGDFAYSFIPCDEREGGPTSEEDDNGVSMLEDDIPEENVNPSAGLDNEGSNSSGSEEKSWEEMGYNITDGTNANREAGE
jgi:hypothetical protein